MSNSSLVIIPAPPPPRPSPLGGFRAAPIATRRVLPGFGLTLGFTMTYASIIVLIPVASTFLKSATLGWGEFWSAVWNPLVVASYKLSFGASAAAAAVNAVFGLIIAWVLVRYKFPGRRLLDAMVDLPFALPTAVAGIALCFLYAENGWIGSLLEPLGIKVAYTSLGVFVALTFIGLPFVVRTLQPVIEDLEPELEEASATLGATRWQTLRKVVFPALLPAQLTGFTLAFARALGEYGSVVFISSNIPGKSQITPMLIITRLNEHNVAEATAIAVAMLVVSFVLLLGVNLLQRWTQRRSGRDVV